MSGVKDKLMSFFKINTTKDYSKPKRDKNVSGAGNKPKKRTEFTIRAQHN